MGTIIANGSIETQGCMNRNLIFSWKLNSDDQSIVNNTSTISWTLTGGGSRPQGKWVIAKSIKLIVNGQQVYAQGSSNIELDYGTVVASGTSLIYHNNDGSKNFNASISGTIYNHELEQVARGDWWLPTIPRKATITSGPSSFTEEDSPVFYYNNPAGSVVTLQYAIMNDNSEWLNTYQSASSTSDHFTFNFDQATKRALIKNCGNYNNAKIYVYLKTTIPTPNGGSTEYWSYKTCQFYISSSGKSPTFPNDFVTYKDSNTNISSLTKNDQLIVQNKSNLTIYFKQVTPSPGTSIASYTFTLNGDSKTIYSGFSGSLNFGKINLGSNTDLKISVTDKRGNVFSKYKTINIISYKDPIIKSINIFRSDKSGNPTTEGNFLNYIHEIIYDTLPNNAIVVDYHYKVKEKETISKVPLIELTTTEEKNSNIDAYIVVHDAYGGSTRSSRISVLGKSRIMNFTKDGTGVAIGKMAEASETFDCQWNVKFRGEMFDAPVFSLWDIPNDNFITSGKDLNDYITPGIYAITQNAFLPNITNAPPTNSAGRLIVMMTMGGKVIGAPWSYMKQIYIPFNSGDMYSRHMYTDSSAGNWKFYAWEKLSAISSEGSSGIWQYRKWTNGVAECWGSKSITENCNKVWYETSYGSMHRELYPFTFSERPKEVVTVHSSNGIWLYQEGINTTTQTGNYGVMRPGSAPLSTVSVTFDYYVKGRWQ